MKTPLLADELEAQYRDLGNGVINNAYRDVITKAKNIVEAVIGEKVGSVGKSRDLFADLQKIKRLLEDAKKRQSSGWSDLEYNLASKIRIAHGQTHATGPAKTGRLLRPEFALSIIEDLNELLRIWGYAKP